MGFLWDTAEMLVKKLLDFDWIKSNPCGWTKSGCSAPIFFFVDLFKVIVYFVPWSMVNHHHPSILCKSKFWNGINFRSFSNEISGQHVPAIFFWYAQEPPVPERSVRLPWHPCYSIFTHTYQKNQPNAGKCTMHGWYGYGSGFQIIIFLWRVLANKKLTNKCRKRDVFCSMVLNMINGGIFASSNCCIFFVRRTIHVWYTYPHLQLPSKFLTDPLIHQDILLTNGDLPSEDGLVKSDRRWLTPLKTEGMNTWWNHTNFEKRYPQRHWKSTIFDGIYQEGSRCSMVMFFFTRG